ncbi:hypothetical protein BGZ83_006958 [Gryganskiella cystojenkinii]|nr:hypothetical protein BGZ83_006958 [Gryganskiella cystojenkinii]
MLLLRHCNLSSEDLITTERALLRFTSGRVKPVDQNFNVWDYTVPEIYGYILGMFVHLDLVNTLGISSDELLDFIIDVDRGYLATFYHSFYHAADVTAVLFHMLQGMQASRYLPKPDMAALLLAGLCHDIGHPGLNNLFQVNAKTELVKEFGEASVLEKYSCSLAMDLVSKHGLFRNIHRSSLAMLPEGRPATESSMRDAMIKAILATDMSFHYDMLKGLNSLVDACSTPVSSPNASEADSESDSDLDLDSEHGSDDTLEQEFHYLDEEGIDHVVRHQDLDNDTSSGLETLVPAIPPTSHPQLSIQVDGVPAAGLSRRKTVTMVSPVSTDIPKLDSPTVEKFNRQRTWSAGSLDSEGSSVYYSVASHLTDRCAPVVLNLEQRQQLCNCLLHAADISNAVKPWTICKRWSDLVVQEFFRQGDIEKAQDLPVSPNMDRNQHNQPQISLGFGDFVVQPYFEVLAELLPRAIPVLDSLASNREQWLALQKASQQFGNDPYLVVDPLEDDPSQATISSGPSSPMLPFIPPGRRVSVAAGVLVLDDSQPLRTPHRRLRHSTNTELNSHGHRLHKMKRSFSNRSLSTSLHNLHVSTGSTVIPRASLSSARVGHSQELFPVGTLLRRQASLIGREGTSSSDLLPPFPRPAPAPRGNSGPTYTPSMSLYPDFTSSKDKDQDQDKARDKDQDKDKDKDKDALGPLSQPSKTKPIEDTQTAQTGGSRQKRLASLQVMNNNAQDARNEQITYGEGQEPPSPSVTKPRSSTTSSPSQAGTGTNRSSTPAVMMNKIKYDWAMSPRLPENPVRSGFGPLDDLNVASDHPLIVAALLPAEKIPSVVDPSRTSVKTDKEDEEPEAGSSTTSTCTSSIASYPASPSTGRGDGTVAIATASSHGSSSEGQY